MATDASHGCAHKVTLSKGSMRRFVGGQLSASCARRLNLSNNKWAKAIRCAINTPDGIGSRCSPLARDLSPETTRHQRGAVLKAQVIRNSIAH